MYNYQRPHFIIFYNSRSFGKTNGMSSGSGGGSFRRGGSSNGSSYGNRGNSGGGYGGSNNRFRNGNANGGGRFGAGGGRNNNSGSAGSRLRKPTWDLKDLRPFKKDFYVPIPAVANRSPYEIEQFRRSKEITVDGRDVPPPIQHFEEASFPDYVMQVRIFALPAK